MLDYAGRLREKLKRWKSGENHSENQRTMLRAAEEDLASLEATLESYCTNKEYAHLRQKSDGRFGKTSAKD